MEQEKQTNYTIAEGYELPSKGLIYDKPINPKVELRSMTARDEMKRLSPSSTPLKTLADIIEGCMLEKPAIHVYDMCFGDYEYLLHRLRVITYGPDYAISVSCPYCGEQIETNANLDKLTKRNFDAEEFKATQCFTLPKSKKEIVLNFQTPRMIDEAEQKAKDLKRKFQGASLDFNTYVKLCDGIATIDGQQIPPYEMDSFIMSLPAMDMQKILNNIDRLSDMVGIDSSIYLNCPNCGREIKTFFRFGTEFFRPSNI